MLAYFTDPSKWATGVVGSPTQMADAEGHISIVNSEVSDNAQWHVAVPTDHCAGVTDAQRYKAQSNPGGVRCDIQDAAINVFGPNPPACARAPGFVAGSSLGPVRLGMTRAQTRRVFPGYSTRRRHYMDFFCPQILLTEDAEPRPLSAGAPAG